MLRTSDGDRVLTVDELQRLDELRRYDPAELGVDGALDRLAELAGRACHAPIAVISFVDERQQQFLARWNVPESLGEGIPRELSICAHLIEHREPLYVIEDLAADARFGRSPLVLQLGLGFYASVPLVTPGGSTLGTVCVVDHKPRTLDAGEARELGLVRDQVMELLETRRELGELRRSEALRQEAVEALVATQHDLQARIDLRTREIEAAHQKTRQILERIGDAYLVLDRDARVVYVNPRATQMLGRSAAELAGKQLWAEFPGGGGQLREPYERALREQTAATVQVRYAPWDRWFEGRIHPAPDGAAMVFTEITDRKRAEAEAERFRQWLIEAQRVAHVGSFEFDIAGDRVVWSDEMYKIYGVSLGTTIAGYKDFLSRVHPEDLERTQRIVGEAMDKGTPMIYDHRIVRSDGTTRVLHTRAQALRDEGGVARIVGCCWDVTELHAASAALQRNVALLAATLEVTSDGLLVVDAAGKITAHNAQLTALFTVPAGGGAQTLEGLAAQLADAEQLLGRARALGPADVSFDTLTLRDGRRVEARSRPHLVDGEVAGRVWSFRPAPQPA